MTSALRGSCCCAAAVCTCFPTCPAGSFCENFGFGQDRCNAPDTSPCCKTYSMSASFSIIPYGCCNLDEFVDPFCAAPTPTLAAIYDCNNGTVISTSSCHVDSYIPTGSGSITCTFPTLNLGGGRCDIDGRFLPNVIGGISTTNTFSCTTGGGGYLATEFKIKVERFCNTIEVVLTYSYQLECAYTAGPPPVPCQCTLTGLPLITTYTLNYTKVPGTGTCNIDGTYSLVLATCNKEMDSRWMYRNAIEDPPLCPSDCCNSTSPTTTVVNCFYFTPATGTFACIGSLPALQSFPATITVT